MVPDSLKCKVDMIFEYVDELLGTSVNTSVPSGSH